MDQDTRVFESVIGADINAFTVCDGRVGCSRAARHLRRPCCRSGAARSRHRARRCGRAVGGLVVNSGNYRFREEGGFVAVVNLPLVPKENHGEAKNDP